MQRVKWDLTFMNIVEQIAKRSLCVKVQTAAIIVKDNQILAIGYNGTQSKAIECKDYWDNYITDYNYGPKFYQGRTFKLLHREWSKKYEIHAEQNALRHITKIVPNTIMYTLYSPCLQCAKCIISYGISKVVYKYEYTHTDGIKLLNEFNIPCVKVKK